MAGFKRRQPPSLIWVHNKAWAESSGEEPRGGSTVKSRSSVTGKHSASHMLTCRRCLHAMLLYNASRIAHKIHKNNRFQTDIWIFFFIVIVWYMFNIKHKGLQWTIMTTDVQTKQNIGIKDRYWVFKGHWFSDTHCTTDQIITIISVPCVNKYLRSLFSSRFL